MSVESRQHVGANFARERKKLAGSLVLGGFERLQSTGEEWLVPVSSSVQGMHHSALGKGKSPTDSSQRLTLLPRRLTKAFRNPSAGFGTWSTSFVVMDYRI